MRIGLRRTATSRRARRAFNGATGALGNFPQSLTGRTSMLALADDAALARLVIAAAQRRARLPPQAFRSRGRGHARAASNCLGTLDILRAPTKHRRHHSMPPLRRPHRGPKPDRRRALELLASLPRRPREGVDDRDGFTACATGLATAHSQRVVAGGGGRTIEAARLKITEAGRQALTEEPA